LSFYREKQSIIKDIKEFTSFLVAYLHSRSYLFFKYFEGLKDLLVSGLRFRRGAYIRPFLHTFLSVLFVLAFALAPLIKEAIPQEGGSAGTVLGQTDNSLITQVSIKPRDSLVSYTVVPGDTISSIAKKFGISTDTIRWQNDLKSVDDIKPGQQLEIPPVTGIVHKVKRGETIYSISKKYGVDAQAIVNWPFNTFSNDETFSLAVGQLVVVPDGVKPEEKPWEQPVYIAKKTPDAGAVSAAGQFIWPTNGVLTQYFRWYHPAIDIANREAPAILAADGGRILIAGWPDATGYGNRVLIDHGNGYQTLYAHLSKIYVSVGQSVNRGEVIGQMGSTGRSTGIHLHFEIHKNGVAQDPLSFLK
jgi:murein DD-endopeptidase MepM/ murein hydrolase activator NlpD